MSDLQTLMSFGGLWAPLLGGLGVAFLAGPIGSVMIWRRLAYFGDTISHAGLLGITLALVFNINVTFGIIFIAVLIASLLLKAEKVLNVTNDTLLAILSHSVLAVGLVTVAWFSEIRIDILGFLYGDILSMNWQDVSLIWGGAVVIFIILGLLWTHLLRLTFHEELAQVEGVPVNRVKACYLFLLAIVVAFTIKVVGVLLMSALLIIPSASARYFAKTPEQMAIHASLIGMLSVGLGIKLSQLSDLPTGPLIVVVSTLLLLTLHFTASCLNYSKR